MDQIPAPDLTLIPYSRASPAQMVQAMFMAKETLGSVYIAITWPQWQEAFVYFQPILLLEPNQVSVTAEGLTAIAQYFDTRYPAPVLEFTLAGTMPAPSSGSEGLLDVQLSLTKHRQKKTYSLHLGVLESLERVSFWRRVSKSTLVNLALKQLLATYPESQVPIP